MNLSSTSIDRPVLATVMSIVIIIFGVIGFSYLGIREYPSVDPPIISVSTNYTGASADVIESQITEPLEEGINGISGIRSLSSISSDGRSTITVEFELGEDLEAAANDVRDRVSQARRNLPPDADPPIVTKADADATTILALTVQSDERSLLELSDIATNTFKERLQTIPGISNIRIWGDKRYAMRLQMDPAKLEAYQLTPLDVRNALLQQNVELPTGNIEGYRSYLTIRTMGRLVTEKDFNEMIIKEENGAVIKFKDIGEAVLDAENQRTLLRGNNKIPMVGIAVTPQPGANYIAIADEFYKRVDQIEEELPDDLKLGYAMDTTLTIRKAITEVEETILIAFGLVVIVIFMFLRDWRTTLIPAIAIPISLIGAFFIMYFADFSINILTLLGIVLATGLVVDDAIVVLENIYQKIESGISPKKAAHEGASEIYFAIISTTVTLAAVFLPIIFLEGVTGRLFREFGVVVAGSVIISAFVSLTLTPMMSARLLRKKERTSKFYKVTERFFERMTNGYNKLLLRFMKFRWTAIVIMFLSIGAIVLLGALLPSELAPLEDKSRIRILSTAPEGTSFELMDDYVMELLNVVDTLQEKAALVAVTSPGFGSSNSVNSSFVRITMTPPSERTRSQQEVAQQLTAITREMNFARSFVVQEQTIQVGRSSGLPVQYVIQAPNLERLKEVLPQFMERASANPNFEVVDLDLKFNKPELAVTIDRERARALGVSVRDIAETIQLFFSGQRFDYFVMDGKQYQIIGEASRVNRDEPLDLSSISVRNKRGELITLNNVVTLETQSTSPQLYRYNRYIAATVSASPAQGVTLGQGIEAMDEIAADLLDESFSTALSGTSKDYEESSGSLYFAFGLALVLIYLVLAAQFESFVDPLIIMFTVPLALTGALLTLWLFGHTLNIFSQIGIIVLIGIVTKNGILIVEFANQRKEDGLNKFDAVIEAATLRLRPILMTSLATILGTLPIALALGAASTSRIPMGMAIIGGLLFSLILTLLVIPITYTYMSGNATVKAKVEPKHR
ncbi:efflux RND transporter permease subunit [Catalinimonas niigatensis]|uniref:efflux RND transporter permease subunit n=1 Tax=Catalinimonas niigatensis TaxID=1397264 RepID=UPI002665DC41|nr:efflux RND transporter permease subunit [Catalinimonas niigatensis]WPP53290.1 efflux RND transporter permease subunit [Catalinimonas niigatensis]